MVCEHCKRPEGAVNHVPGHIFVGMGHGWQPCPHCSSEKDPKAARIASLESQLAEVTAEREQFAAALCQTAFFRDHACVRCVPNGDALVPGFTCARHCAQDLIPPKEAK